MTLAPIVLFVYNRPWHTQQTIEALEKNELARESELFIYSDAAKNASDSAQVTKVREYIRSINGFKKITIIERKKNWGLANSIIDGVTTIVNQYGKIIVLEDDLVTSSHFLKFMNTSLLMYENEINVACIHGYIYPIKDLPETFFIRGADCWGWATWKDKWAIFEPDGQKLLDELKQKNLSKEADFSNTTNYSQMLKDQILGNNNSWAVRWYISAFLKEMLCLYPGKSYVQNIGTDDSGTHCGVTDLYRVELSQIDDIKKIPQDEDFEARRKMESFFRALQPSLFVRVFSKIKKVFR